jgi:ankyrin repeat protein
MDNDGYTPLHFASQRGHLDVVEYLISKCGKLDDLTIKYLRSNKGYKFEDLISKGNIKG